MVVGGGGGGCIGQRPILLLLRAKIEIELRASQSLSITNNENLLSMVEELHPKLKLDMPSST